MLNDQTYAFDASFVTFYSEESTLLGPTAISIHDDGDVARHVVSRHNVAFGFGLGYAMRPQTVRISFSLAASI